MVLNKNHKKEKSHQSKANLNQGLVRGLRQESVCLAALQVSGSERTPPQHPCKELGIVMHTCNPRDGDMGDR